MERIKFESRCLSRVDATAIAESQKDLGGQSKIDMAVALGGKKYEDASLVAYEQHTKDRMAAYQNLDPLSRLIVKEILDGDDIYSAITNIEYCIQNLKNALTVLENLQK